MAPPPKYFTPEYMRENFDLNLPTDSASILHNFTIPEQGGLICTNQQALQKQKGVLGDVLKQIVKNSLKGLSISHISLPIKIFEARSSLHRMADLWTFAPQFLKKAA